MFSLGNFITGIIMIALGALTLRYNYQVVGFTGRQDWIENKLGSGSTYFTFKLLSLLLVIVGVLFATGLGGSFMNWITSPLRGISGS